MIHMTGCQLCMRNISNKRVGPSLLILFFLNLLHTLPRPICSALRWHKNASIFSYPIKMPNFCTTYLQCNSAFRIDLFYCFKCCCCLFWTTNSCLVLHAGLLNEGFEMFLGHAWRKPRSAWLIYWFEESMKIEDSAKYDLFSMNKKIAAKFNLFLQFCRWRCIVISPGRHKNKRVQSFRAGKD